MSSIFPREQRVEQLFDRILRDPRACRRLKETFYESCPETDLMDADSVEASDKIFANALIRAYQNQDLSAFLMAICGNSMFDLLRNSFLIPLRFNDKDVENPVILTDETGTLRDNLPVAVPDKKYKIFCDLYREKPEIRDFQMCLAYGFRERHFYSEDLKVQTDKIGEHLGVLLLYQLPKDIENHAADAEIYATVWNYMMQLEETLPRAFMYYGKMEKDGKELESDRIGIFLPFHHFESRMKKYMEMANGIGLACRGNIVDMLRDRASITPAKK